MDCYYRTIETLANSSALEADFVEAVIIIRNIDLTVLTLLSHFFLTILLRIFRKNQILYIIRRYRFNDSDFINPIFVYCFDDLVKDILEESNMRL